MKKVFKTIDEQIQILRDKGLILEDENIIRDILLRENYFFISGYRHLFLKSESSTTFKNGTTFKELYALFNFDRQLRNIIFKNLLIIENNLKSIFSYQLSKNYGYKESEYLKPQNFNILNGKSRQVNDLIKKIKRQIRTNGGQHSATSHYMYNYGYVPLWIVVKVLSFGIVCELFIIMKPTDQNDISNLLNISIDELITYLPILANYRNLCAHEDILFDHKTATYIKRCSIHDKLNMPYYQEGNGTGYNDIYALIVIMKRILRDEEFRLMMKEIEYEINALEGKLKTIDIQVVLNVLGFPENYMDILNI